ncbi:MAG: hypothetical protein ACD_75C00105G0002 [uncultured bacterium]|nr:MAG: hypothetical protein ACD_75C00105G0002 [uncultured bacterium]
MSLSPHYTFSNNFTTGDTPRRYKESKIKILPFPFRHYYNFSSIEELAATGKLPPKTE